MSPAATTGEGRRLLAQGSGVLVANFASVVLALIVQIVLARGLPVSEFGAYQYALALANFIAIPVAAGWEVLSVRSLAGNLDRKWRVSFMKLVASRLTANSAVAAAFVMGIAWWQSGHDRPIALAILLIPAVAGLKVINGAFQGSGLPIQGAIAQGAGRAALFLGLLLGAGALGAHRVSANALLVTTVAAWLSLIVCARYLSRRWSAIGASEAVEGAQLKGRERDLFKSSRALGIVAVTQAVVWSLDTVLLGHVGGNSDIATYAAAKQLALPVLFVTAAASSIVAPRLAASFSQDDPDEMRKLLWHAWHWTLGYGLLFLAALALGGTWVLSWFGEAYTDALPVTLILIAGHVASIACGDVGTLLAMTGYERVVAKTTVIMALAFIPVAILFGGTAGGIGVAAGVGLVTSARAATLTIIAHKRLGFTAIGAI